ncbi:unnamed protein product [Timema podura]|uniref:Uncharacterized protein n=1 Tax=Timema podura TaxID=61482 RepID=A0ABN7PN29_TIMPD|nr:unnamed protein product [Timema podura]
MNNAAWVSYVLTTPEKISLQRPTPQEENTFLFPNRAYEETLQISGEKFRDLQHLKTFCGDEVKAYFDNLKYEKKENK